MKKKEKYLVAPNIHDNFLTKSISGFDESFKRLKIDVINEKSCICYKQTAIFNVNRGVLGVSIWLMI